MANLSNGAQAVLSMKYLNFENPWMGKDDPKTSNNNQMNNRSKQIANPVSTDLEPLKSKSDTDIDAVQMIFGIVSILLILWLTLNKSECFLSVF